MRIIQSPAKKISVCGVYFGMSELTVGFSINNDDFLMEFSRQKMEFKN
jgi:hypothetical protein